MAQKSNTITKAIDPLDKIFRVDKVFLTYSQIQGDFSLDDVVALAHQLNAKKMIASREQHHKTDGLHIHVYMAFSCRRRFTYRQFIIKGLTANIVKSDPRVINYILKDKDKYELWDCRHFGFSNEELNSFLNPQAKDDTKLKNQKYVDLFTGVLSLKEFIFSNPFYVTQYTKIKNNLSSFWNDLNDSRYRFADFESLHLKNYWIYGKTGIGKSFTSMLLWPNHFRKSAGDNWFDGYCGQTTVILEEFSSKSNLGNGLLRILADPYKCLMQVKFGFVNMRHFRVVVLSNYSIDQMFHDPSDLTDYHNIKRRFIEINANSQLHNGYWQIPQWRDLDFEAYDLTEKECDLLHINFAEIKQFVQDDVRTKMKMNALNQGMTLCKKLYDQWYSRNQLIDPDDDNDMLIDEEEDEINKDDANFINDGDITVEGDLSVVSNEEELATDIYKELQNLK